MAAQRYPSMARGMLAQVNRVNGTDDPRVRDLLHQNAELQEVIADLRRQLAVAGVGATHESPIDEETNDPSKPRATLTHEGRPAATARHVAEFYGVSHSTITRQLDSGKLAGIKYGSTRWYVYLDQPIGPFKAHKHRGN